ncbi:MAG: hypothetical protein M3Q15_06795, partial [Pseudomonadota bacterium]|nr:hypothetical protein [Pseudomonadota bacterium]
MRLPPALARLSRRERILLGIGVVVVILFLAFLFWPDDEPETAGVELAASAPVATPPFVPAPAVMPLAPAVPSVSVDGVVLRGVMGGGPRGGAAIFLLPNAGELVVRVGRELVPGL